MDLQGVVGARPGDPRGQQLGHAGLHIAAVSGIFFAAREPGELAGDHGLHRHPGELARDPREAVDGAAELVALERVGEAEIEGVLGDADGPRRGLDTRRFEGLHELLEAAPRLTAEQGVAGYREAVEGNLIFLHAAIAEHLDLGAHHAGRRERVVLGAPRLRGQEHGEALVARLALVAAHQQGHQIGARGMGDPGLVAGDAPVIAVAHRAAPQAAQVRAGAGFGEYRRR